MMMVKVRTEGCESAWFLRADATASIVWSSAKNSRSVPVNSAAPNVAVDVALLNVTPSNWDQSMADGSSRTSPLRA